MNTYITINYIILGVLFAFLLAEAMSAMAFLYDKKSLPNVKKYLDPIWAIVGTFAVFFVVNTEVLYPSIMPSIDYLYVFPILLATLLFIARNMLLVFSEYIWKNSKFSQLLLARIYSLVSFVIVIILLGVFLSIITGLGTNASLNSFSFSAFLSNYYSIGFIAGILLIAFGLMFAFYGIKKLKVLSPISTIIGLLIFVLSMQGLGLYVNYITYILAAAVAAISVMYLITGKSRREAILITAFLSVLSINLLNYGKVFGTLSLSSFINNSAVNSAGLIVTIIGGILLTIMLVFFLYMYKRPETNTDYQKDYKDEQNPFSNIGIANLYIMPKNNKENGKEHKKGKNRVR